MMVPQGEPIIIRRKDAKEVVYHYTIPPAILSVLVTPPQSDRAIGE
jgi:hypothetical protein